MPLDQLGIYIYKLGCHIMPVRDDGFCFLNAIDLVLYCNHNEVLTLDSMASNILGHFMENVNIYKWFHTGDVLKDTEGYFKFGSYCDSVRNVNYYCHCKSSTVEPVNLSERAKRKHKNSQANHKHHRYRGSL